MNDHKTHYPSTQFPDHGEYSINLDTDRNGNRLKKLFCWYVKFPFKNYIITTLNLLIVYSYNYIPKDWEKCINEQSHFGSLSVHSSHLEIV